MREKNKYTNIKGEWKHKEVKGTVCVYVVIWYDVQISPELFWHNLSCIMLSAHWPMLEITAYVRTWEMLESLCTNQWRRKSRVTKCSDVKSDSKSFILKDLSARQRWGPTQRECFMTNNFTRRVKSKKTSFFEWVFFFALLGDWVAKCFLPFDFKTR